MATWQREARASEAIRRTEAAGSLDEDEGADSDDSGFDRRTKDSRSG